jgi:hypothetical protein
MDGFVSCAMPVAHQDRDIVTGTADVMVNQQGGALLGNMTPNAVQHLPGGTDMAADRTDIGFDDAEGDSHGETPLLENNDEHNSCVSVS